METNKFQIEIPPDEFGNILASLKYGLECITMHKSELDRLIKVSSNVCIVDTLPVFLEQKNTLEERYNSLYMLYHGLQKQEQLATQSC